MTKIGLMTAMLAASTSDVPRRSRPLPAFYFVQNPITSFHNPPGSTDPKTRAARKLRRMRRMRLRKLRGWH